MLSIDRRLRRKDDITKVGRGKGAKNEYIGLKFLPSDLQESRFGFVISSKSIKKASRRNLIKRRAREIIKKNLPGIKEGTDILFFFSPKSGELGYNELEEKILSLLKSARLM